MSKTEDALNSVDLSVEDYQKLLENLRIRINVLNASVFLLEEKMTSKDLMIANYLATINKELKEIRKMMMPCPMPLVKTN